LNWTNLRTLADLKPELSLVARLPEEGALTKAFLSSPRLQAIFQKPYLPTVQVEAGVAHNPLSRLFNRAGFPRFGLEAYVPFPAAVRAAPAVGAASAASLPVAAANDTAPAAAIETMAAREGTSLLETASGARGVAAGEGLLARAALGAPARAALPEVEEVLMLTETAMAGSRVRVSGLPLLAFAVGVGIAFGLCYATGMFDTRYGARDMTRDLTGR
jgi:hypothetical protein